ncbi:MAG TPA: M28 family peptidase [Longimicrobiaceae bacterium]|nr:M28 family peptidase [Longimicrobiaceae bacterium]
MSSVRSVRLGLPLLALVGCAPAGGTGAAPADTIDGDRLLQHVQVLSADSMQGRRTGTPGVDRARSYLLDELQRIGVEPAVPGYTQHFSFTARDSSRREGVNLLARVRGTRWPNRYIVVTAHYDHMGIGRPVNGDSIYNGADDNASGTATLLELARHFRARPPESSILFALLDAEEMGLRGARAFVMSPPIADDAIVLNVNMDMVSHSEKGELYAAGASLYPFLRPHLERVAARAPIRLLLGHDRPVPTPQDDWTLQSDQGAFHQAGIPFVYFGVEDHPDYHQPSDEFGSITPQFFVGAARTIADAVRTLDRNLPQIERQRAR